MAGKGADLISELRRRGAQSVTDVLSDILADDIPVTCVDFVTFCTSSDYLGLDNIYPFWLQEFKQGIPDISSLVLTGSLGGGKTTMANAFTAYKLYLLFSKGDICRTLGIMTGTPIYYLYFSVSLKQAEKSGFAQLRAMLDGSKWFQTNYPTDKNIRSSIKFSNGFRIDYASGESHAIGLAVLGFMLDEANFFTGVGAGSADEYSKVMALAQQLEDRQMSRFMRNGKLISFSVYVSSASYSNSFIMDKMLELRDVPYAKIVTAVKYKISPQDYSKTTFRVFIGYNTLSPAIIGNKAHEASLRKAVGLGGKACDAYFESVPDNLLPQFKKDIYKAIQNHCGRATASRGGFITNYDIIKECYVYDYMDYCPILQDGVVVSNGDGARISDIVDWRRFVYNDNPHSVYLDLSLSGDYGCLSCFRYDGDDANGNHRHTQVFTISIIPPEFPAQVQISKIKDFVLELAGHVNLVAFGSDNFQSVGIRQDILAALRLQDIRLSLDSTDTFHLMWLAACVDRRIVMQYHELQDREIREAIHDVRRHKVYKREGSSDDQFQGCVGSFFLSETIGANVGNIDSLLDARLNLVGSQSVNKLLSRLGYNTDIGSVRIDKGGNVRESYLRQLDRHVDKDTGEIKLPRRVAQMFSGLDAE